MKRPKVIYFYQYKAPMDSHCLLCDAPCNRIAELSDGSDFRCCPKCVHENYKYRKDPMKSPPKSRSLIFKQKSRMKSAYQGILRDGQSLLIVGERK